MSTAVEAKRPNLLFIVTDEQSFRTLGCYRALLPKEQAEMWGAGNVVETPNLDAIAERGTLFDRMYASSPVCTPARATMFTGMYGHQVGMPSNSTKTGDGKYLKSDVTTIAQVLGAAGYATGYSGKWHLSENAEKAEEWAPFPVGKPGYNYGFQDNKFMFAGGHDKWKGIDAEGNPYRAAKNPKLIGNDESGQPVYEDKRSKNVKSTTDWLADRTMDFIEEHKNEPFYYVVSIPDPHTPDEVRAPYDTMYTDMKFELPRTFDAPRPEGTPKWQMPDGKATKLAEHLSQYFGMVKNIDDNIGRILEKLEKEGVLENTIIVFTSDHGDLMGEHARMNKGTPHETSARVPFLIAHGKNTESPLIPRGKVVTHAANTTDWMPTFLSLLNVAAPELPGRDLTPLLAEEPPADWNDVTFSYLGFIAAIDSRYKLVVSPWDTPWLLDIEADPDELVNFINDPKYADVAKRLAPEVKGFAEKFGVQNKKITAYLEEIIAR
ncbi:MAG: sulfatase-like hydrolase/transferase [Luteolibacter sp.]